MSILLGLVSAFFYGATDFVARSSSRRLGVLTTMLWAQASAALLTSLALLIASPSQRVTLEMAAFLVSSDLLILGATGLLYYALSVGRLSVVAPVGATYGGVTAMLSIASGETLAPVPGIGLVVLLVGVVLVARPQKQRRRRNMAMDSSRRQRRPRSTAWVSGFRGAMSFPR
jgi:drug/metabolite transporter (DMT)-like permease